MKLFIDSISNLRVLVILLVLVIAVLLRLLGINRSLWLDEASTLSIVFAPDFIAALRSYDHPPLYLMILKAWSVLGKTEPFLRMPSVLFGLGTVWVIMADLRRNHPQAALLAGFLGAVSPILLHYSQEIRGYALLIFMTALVYYFANELIQNPHSLIQKICLATCLVAAACSHLVGIFLIPSTIVYLISHPGMRNWRRLVFLAVPLIVFLLVFYVFMSSELRIRTSADWGEGQLSLALLVVSFAYISGLFSTLIPFPALMSGESSFPFHPITIGMFLVLALWITGSMLANWKKGLPYLLAALAYLLGLIVYSLMFTVIVTGSTFLPLVPPLIAFVSIQRASSRPDWKQTVTLIALMGLCLGGLLNWVTYTAWKPAEDWRALSQEVSKHWHPEGTLALLPGYTQVSFFYYNPEITQENFLALPIYPNEQFPPDQVRRDLQEKFSPRIQLSPQINLVYRPDAQMLRDTRSLTIIETLLKEDYDLVETTTFGWLTLYRYQIQNR